MSDASTKKAISAISELISREAGIQLGERQAHMVEGRVRTRMLRLGIERFDAYLAYLEKNHAAETQVLLSLLTTHHTFFFREMLQIDMMRDNFLGTLCEMARQRGDRTIRCWSAAASRGQEAYSLAMFLKAHLAQTAPDIKFTIVGTDVDPESIRLARNGVYHGRDLKSVPLFYQQGLWARGTGEIADFVSARQPLRDAVSFSVHNLLDKDLHPFSERFDLILCRNLFIYFVGDQVEFAVKKLAQNLTSGGLLLIGLSESLNGLNVPVQPLSHSVYAPEGSPHFRRTPARAAAPVTTGPTAKAPAAPVAAPAPAPNPRKTRILCVDDSPSVLAILQRALTAEHGFEVVGTAGDGEQAVEAVQRLKPDAMTLDIHMPRLDGLGYLKAHYRPGHPPVIMVSSVAREEKDLAFTALRLGASDYVEKPTLADFGERSEELRGKIKAALAAKSSGRALDLTLDAQTATSSQSSRSSHGKLRFVLAGPTDLPKLKSLVLALGSKQPATVFLCPAGVAPDAFARELGAALGRTVNTLPARPSGALAPDTLWTAEARSGLAGLAAASSTKPPTSVLVFGRPEARLVSELRAWPAAQLLVEDVGPGSASDAWSAVASDVVPATSFPYMSSRFLDTKAAA